MTLQAQTDGLVKEISRLTHEIAAAADPTSPSYAVFLARALSGMKQQVAQALYQEHRAYEYWSLSYVPFQLASFDLLSMRTLHDHIKSP